MTAWTQQKRLVNLKTAIEAMQNGIQSGKNLGKSEECLSVWQLHTLT